MIGTGLLSDYGSTPHREDAIHGSGLEDGSDLLAVDGLGHGRAVMDDEAGDLLKLGVVVREQRDEAVMQFAWRPLGGEGTA